MRSGGGLLFYTYLLLWLLLLLQSGYSNQGSHVGSCSCKKVYLSNSPPSTQELETFKKKLDGYQRCGRSVRFQLHSSRRMTVCGGSKDQWVLHLMDCFDQGECGYTRFLPTSKQVPESTEKMFLNNSTHVMTYLSPTLQSTQQSTLAAGTTTLDNFTQANETMTSMGGQTLGNNSNKLRVEKEKTRNESSPALVLVLSILGIFLAVLIFFVWWKRNQQSRQNSPDFQIHYIPVVPNSNT